MKCNVTMNLGEWMQSDVRSLQLTPEEEEAIYEAYIPQYFEDGAPLSIMLGNAFAYTPGEKKWVIGYERPCSQEDEDLVPSCGVLRSHFYIGADGMVAPCMAMCEHAFSDRFPNLRETPLKEILRDSDFVRLCETTVGEIRKKNEKCRECPWLSKCSAGCRSEALRSTDDYFAADPTYCRFFERGWDRTIRAAAEPAFEKYMQRKAAGHDS